MSDFISPCSLDTCVRRLRALHQEPDPRPIRGQRIESQVIRQSVDDYNFRIRHVGRWVLGDPDHFPGIWAVGYLQRQDATHTAVTLQSEVEGLRRLGKPLLLTFVFIVLIVWIVRPEWLLMAIVVAGVWSAGQFIVRLGLRRYQVLRLVRRTLVEEA